MNESNGAQILSIPRLETATSVDDSLNRATRRLPAFAGPNSARLSTAKAFWRKPSPFTTDSSEKQNLEVWPAGAGSTYDERMYASKATPRFLQQLQNYLDQELSQLPDTSDLPSETRLQVFREVFEFIIRDFRSYQPILSAIKHEYELLLSHFAQQIKLMQPLQSRLSTLRAEADSTIKSMLFRTESSERQLEEGLRDTERENRELRTKVDILSMENEELREQLTTSESLLLESKESRSLLYRAMRRMQDEHDAGGTNADEEESIQSLQAKLSRAQADLSTTLADLAQKNDELKSRVARSKLEETENELARSRSHLAAIKKTYQTLAAEHAGVNHRLEQIARLQEETAAECEQLRQCQHRTVDWSIAAQHIPNLELENRTDEDIVEQICREYDKLSGTKRGVRGVSRISKAGPEYFESKGQGSDVPKYLRYPGGQMIRNRRLAKRDAEIMIKDIWDEKAKYDKLHSTKEPLENFVAFYLQQRFGISNVIAEYAYSFSDALDRFDYDADFDLFRKILHGDLEEAVYQDQMNMLSDLKAYIARLASREAGHPCETISLDTLIVALKRYFPGKSEDNVRALGMALHEQPHAEGSVRWVALFEEDREGNQCAFMEMLRDQHVREREEYLGHLEGLLKDIYMQKEVQRQEDFGKVSLVDVKQAFEKIDPNKRDSELETYLSRGFGINPKHLTADTTIVVTEFLRKLRRGVVRRSTKQVIVKADTPTHRPSIFASLATATKAKSKPTT